jgi:uncharacterized protein (TIGR04255 family)
MNQKIPDRLIKEPLLEVIWEIRFSGAISPVSDLLPGMIFNSFPEKYDRVTRLPVSDIPTPFVENDPNLRYAPKIRFERGNGAIQIGDRVLSISCRRPYSGWKQFSHDIKRLSKIVQETGLVKCLERFSLKYIDLIELEKAGSLSHLYIEMKMGAYDLATKPVQLRTEIEEDDLIHIIQIISPIEVGLPDIEGRLKGVLVEIDTIKTMTNGESWNTLFNELDNVHAASKKMFFSILKPETVQRLEPEYHG